MAAAAFLRGPMAASSCCSPSAVNSSPTNSRIAAVIGRDRQRRLSPLSKFARPQIDLSSSFLGCSQGRVILVRRKCAGEKSEGKEENTSKSGICASLATPLIAATDTWGTWTVLLAAGSFGLWYEYSHFSLWGNNVIETPWIGLLKTDSNFFWY